MKRSREGGDVSRETKEGGVPVFGGGLPSLPPDAPAFSLPFCPHPPDPLPGGKGEIFLFSYARGSAPCIPGVEPARHWLFSAVSVFFCSHPPTPFPVGRGRPKLFHARGFAPCIPGVEPARHWLNRGGLAPPAPLRLSPRGIGFFCRVSAFLPPSSRPPSPVGKGEIFDLFCRGLAPPAPLLLNRAVLACRKAPPLASPGLNLRGAGSVGAGAPGTPAAKPGRHWLFLPRQCFSVPIPPTRARRALFPAGRGDFCFILPGAGAPGTPATEPARRWLAGRLRPLHPRG